MGPIDEISRRFFSEQIALTLDRLGRGEWVWTMIVGLITHREGYAEAVG